MAKERIRDGTAPDLSKLEAEKRKLLVSKSNPKRLKIVTDLLDWINWGIKY